MTRSLRPAGTALVAVVALLGSVLIATPADAAPGPTISITAPQSSSVKGLTTLSAKATTDPGDTFVSVKLFVDNVDVQADASACIGTDVDCVISTDYDFTNASGQHTVSAQVVTLSTATSTDSVTFTVANPLPTVSITDPGVVTGTAGISVQASTDSKLSDYPKTIAVVVDAGTAGARTLTPVTCNGVGDRTCSGTTPWNSSALSGTHTITATVTTTNGATNTASRDVTVVSPAPTVSITDPTGGSTVSGTVVVSATASTDIRLSEVPASVSLYVDDVLTETQPCVAATNDCSLTLSWDATGVTGDHVLRTTVTTTASRTADSANVTVTVTTPPFDVAITSPAAGTVVVGSGATALTSGLVRVSLGASTDQTQNEFPATIQLLVDGSPVAGAVVTCAGPPNRVCAGTVTWDTRRTAGGHKLAALVTTNRSHEATSPSRTVYTRSGSRVGFYAIAPAVFGGVATVRGRVVSTTSGAPLVGVWVRLIFAPAIGKGRVALVKTGVGGVFSYRTRVYSNTRTTALVGNTWVMRGTAVTTLRVRAPMSCSTTATAYFSGTLGRGRCSVRNLPVGTLVHLRYAYKGRWFTLASGRTTSTTIAFSFRFVPRGTYYLQVVLGSNRVYYATLGSLMRVVIR